LFNDIKTAIEEPIPKKELSARIDSLIDNHNSFQQNYFTEELNTEQDETQSQILDLREVLDDQLKQIADLKIENARIQEEQKY
jgi:hypothetical protein